jgi:hypothetical protein
MLRRLIIYVAYATLLLSYAPAQSAPAASTNDQPQESLADIARKIRAKKKPDVVVTEDDAQTLFKEIDTILTFASGSSGLPKHSPVKHKLMGREDADKFFASARSNEETVTKTLRSELVLKKFGMLPDDFHLQQFLNDRGAGELAGFYDFRDKTMYLLNWIPLEKQRPVMAHELTHALQDQNYDLLKWRNPKGSAKASGDNSSPNDPDAETEARIAVTEGQAMLVYLDYELVPLGTRLAQSTDRFDVLKSRVLSVYDQPVSFRAAPLIFSESARFPYFDGFTFELELLKRVGTAGAFAGVFTRPPRDTHEIIHPEDYLAETRPPAFTLPKLITALGSGYKAYDSGSIGELDVRIMAKQFGRDNDAYTVSPQWNGGAYLAVRKPYAAAKADSELKPSDLALIYVSRWKTAAAAERFASLYKASLIGRSNAFDAASAKGVTCSVKTPDCTSRWYAHFTTDQEPIAMEIASDNTLVITQGLEESLVKEIRQAVARATSDVTAQSEPELTMRFMNLPGVRALREEILRENLRKLANEN